MELCGSNLGAFWRAKGENVPRVAVRVVLAFVFALCLPHVAAANPTSPSVSRGLPFAVADFDGDHRPDLASVQTGLIGDSSSDYWVRFRFSSLGRRYVRVTAPKGGLLVEARDVNGDNAVDLVVASAWLNKPVAILLNDGNGNFSQVDPAHYLDALQAPSRRWNSSRNRYSSAFGLLQESLAGDFSLRTFAEAPDTTQKNLKAHQVPLTISVSLSLCAPRAPPLEILL